MILSEFLEELKGKKIELSYSAGRLKYSGPEEHITPEFIQRLKSNKVKLIKYFWPEALGNLMPVNPEGTRVPLFLIHGDNGNYLLSGYLGKDQPVYGFFHPGSEGEAIKYKSVREMSSAYLEKVLTVYPDGPFYFAGFSFGGVIAFDMALQLQSAGKQVPFLVLIDSISPLAVEPFRWHKSLYGIVRSDLLRPVKMEIIRLTKLAICNSYPLRKKKIPAERRNYYMLEKYRKLTRNYKPEGKYNGKVLLFRTTGNGSSHANLGWESLTGGINSVILDADHTTLFDNEKSAEVLNVEFAKYLSQVSGQKINHHELH